MRVLLDENLDHALRKLLGHHEVFTVAYLGWTGLKNGDLLSAAEDMGFNVIITGDQTMYLEQNLLGRPLAVIALSAIQLPIIRRSIATIVAAIDEATPGSFRSVDCGLFSRKLPPSD